MILTELKTYLSGRRRASLDDIARHFAVAPDAARGMLETWIAKGRVRVLNQHLPCGTCGKCESAVSDIYEWIGIKGCPIGQPETNAMPAREISGS
ncbi:MAG: sugar metabolism transcriptional regulator [Alphaproteobacteria bacterium]|nr:sugar metabolism transcriptional regulator [Alphaproteobacteria bacterium]